MTPRGRRLLVVLFVLTLPLVTPRVRGADEIEYFSYLRSLVFDRDLDFANEYAYFFERDPQGLAGFKATFLDRREPAHRPAHQLRARSGRALLWSPFYLLAHVAVGRARPGRRCRGRRLLLALRRGRRATAPRSTASWACCWCTTRSSRLGGSPRAPRPRWPWRALWLGTPVLYYMTLAPAFSHACVAVRGVARCSGSGCARAARGGTRALADWALVGLAGGLCGLVREQDALFLVVPAAGLAAGTRSARATSRGRSCRARSRWAPRPRSCSCRSSSPTARSTAASARRRWCTRKMSYAEPALPRGAVRSRRTASSSGRRCSSWPRSASSSRPGARRDAVAACSLPACCCRSGSTARVESWTQAGAFGSRRFVAATPVFAWGLAARPGGRSAARWARRAVAAVLAVFVWWNVSLMVQFGLKLMDRQRLEWPRVARQPVHRGAAAARPRGRALLHRPRAAGAGGRVISDALLARVACPVCLEARGLPRLRAATAATTRAARHEYEARVRCACGGPDKVRAARAADGAALSLLRRASTRSTPRTATSTWCRAASVGEVTQYADHEFHERLGVTDAPPLLSARVKADMMRRMLAPARGRGRARPRLRRRQDGALRRARAGAHAAGLDVAPFFLPRAVRGGRPRARRPAPAAVPQGRLPARLLARRARAPRRGGRARRAASRRGA